MSDINWFHIISTLKRHGMTHQQQANEIGVSRRSIGNYETGKVKEPPYSKGCKLIDVYRSVVGST